MGYWTVFCRTAPHRDGHRQLIPEGPGDGEPDIRQSLGFIVDRDDEPVCVLPRSLDD